MNTSIKRIFIPGDEWVYFKVYTGFKTADDILSEVLPTVIKQLEHDHSLRKWFFLRYSDPDNHLRLRFLVPHKSAVCQVVSLMNQSLSSYVEDGLIWKIQMDTYQREIERYGLSTIEYAESVFYYDSESVVSILQHLTDGEADRHRWLLALVMVDALLSDFKFDLDQKTMLLVSLSEGFKKEMGFTLKGFKLQLDKKFRANRNFVEEIMGNRDKPSWAHPALETIKKRSLRMELVVMAILEMEKNQKIDIPLQDLLRSFIHMMLNRLFRAKQRTVELVIYDMLERYYVSLQARNKRTATVREKRNESV